jgi:pseudouridine-5'-phosphate glycosidase
VAVKAVPRAGGRAEREALAAADRQGVRGRDVTPFLLARFHEQTAGASLRANVALMLGNARLAAQIAVAHAGAAGQPGARPA